VSVGVIGIAIDGEQAYSKLQEWLKQIVETWSCPKCHSREKSSIDLFAHEDGTVTELIVCRKCDHDDHNAVLHMGVTFAPVRGRG
jgi:hypothetical protein